MTDYTNEQILLDQNDEELDILKRKTEAIKRASTSLKNKITESNTNLDETSIDMGNLIDLTNHSFEAVSKLVGRKVTYRHCCYLICMFVLILMIIYCFLFKFDWSNKDELEMQKN